MKKLLRTVTVLACFMFIINISASAYVTMGNHVLNGGVGNYGYSKRNFYITSSASGYSSQIRAAMSDWIYTTSRLGITTPISFVETSTQKSSVMDIYAGSYTSYPYNSANAWTEFWIYSTQVSPHSQNWGWNKIYLNSYNMSSYSSTTKKGVVAHEMGHAFGLNENNSNRNSVMCQMGSGRAVTASTADDLNGINYLY